MPPSYGEPGRAAINNSSESHSTILERMLNAIHQQPELASLTTRDSSDPAIALLDACAAVADVLTFYQARIANESYLTTATERRSVLELARAIGYELRPGVAAETLLAFTVESEPGEVVTIPAGTQVQSVPAQDESPQTFETMRTIQARREWNEIRESPRGDEIVAATRAAVASRDQSLALAGTEIPVKRGDSVLIAPAQEVFGRMEPDVQSDRHLLTTLMNVLQGPDEDVTTVQWADSATLAHAGGELFAFGQKSEIFGHNAPQFRSLPAENKSVQADVVPLAGPVQLRSFRHAIRALATVGDRVFAATDARGVFRARIHQGSPTVIEDRWQPCNNGVATLEIHSLFADSRGHLLAGSADGTIFLSSDGGDSWRVSSTLRGQDKDGRIRALTGNVDELGRRHLFAATDNALFQSTDDAETWQRIEVRATSPVSFRALLALRHPRLLVGTTEGAGLIDVLTASASGELNQLKASVRGIARGNSALDVRILTETNVLHFPFEDITLIDPELAPPLIRPETASQLNCVTTIGNELFAGAGLAEFPDEWPEFALAGDSIDLNAEYEGILAGSAIALRQGGESVVRQVSSVSTVRREDFGIEGKITRLELHAGPTLDRFDRRAATVLIESRHLPGRRIPPVKSESRRTGLEVSGPLPLLEAGRQVIISGRQGTKSVTQAAVIASMLHHDTPRPAIAVSADLTLYDDDPITISANIAVASHGQTVDKEVLGSADGTKPDQTFRLGTEPLTWVRAPTEAGVQSTIALRVNDVLWDEVPHLMNATPSSRVYCLRTDNDGRTDILFGDGRRGARPSSGVENVVATYRTGLGTAGNVAARSLTSLLSAPLGVVEVTNPLAATGGASPDTLDQARYNAPKSILALDRVVSIGDYEAFACSFGGIGKASVALLGHGGGQLIHLTIAGLNGERIPPDSDLASSLVAALESRCSRLQPLRIDTFDPIFFSVKVTAFFDSRFRPEAVRAAIGAALTGAFSFHRRNFGQPVADSDVLAAVQSVPGIVGAGVVLHAGNTTKRMPHMLEAQPAFVDPVTKRISRAQMLVYDPASLEVDLEPAA